MEFHRLQCLAAMRATFDNSYYACNLFGRCQYVAETILIINRRRRNYRCRIMEATATGYWECKGWPLVRRPDLTSASFPSTLAPIRPPVLVLVSVYNSRGSAYSVTHITEYNTPSSSYEELLASIKFIMKEENQSNKQF